MTAMSDNRTDVNLDKETKKLSDTKEDSDLLSGSGIRSDVSGDDSVKLDETNSVPCQACRQFELMGLELKKQREDLKRTLLQHLREHHENFNPETCPDVTSETARESQQGDAPATIKDQTHSVRSISDHVTIPSNHHRVLQPPEPYVKRLKGDLAKSIGRRIDGCNLNILNPTSGDGC